MLIAKALTWATTENLTAFIGIASVVCVVALVYYIYDTKKENIRRTVGKFAIWLREDFGLVLTAEYFECWSVGDKSGMIAVRIEMLRIAIDPAKRREVLLAAFDTMVAKALADPERKAKLLADIAKHDEPKTP
jgi:hypothetical protein